MSQITFELILIAVLLVANGIFAMAEIALVSARKARLKTLADEGAAGAKLALDLANSPGKFLSTVQVGITLVGVLAGAVGGANIADKLTHVLGDVPVIGTYAHVISMLFVVSIITYLSVIIGELVPKRLALNNPERIASVLAGPMNWLSKIASPLVNLLNHSSDLLMTLMGVKKSVEPPVSEEEVRVLIDEGLSAGVFRKAEKEWVESVFELDEQTAEDLMTPRPQIVWLSLDDTDEENWRRIAGSGHSNFPVYQKSHEHVVGMISVKSLWANLSLAGNADLSALVVPPLYVPTTMHASKLIEEFKKSGKHIALVVDEFGSVQGLVTLKDLMVAIVGNLPEKEQRREPKAVLRPDGSWLVDALLDIEEVRKVLSIEDELPGEEEGNFTTLGGFLLDRFGHLPNEGENLVWDRHRFEIIDMDNQRIDKVLVTEIKPPKSSAEDEAANSAANI